jgi:hypothetical protein
MAKALVIIDVQKGMFDPNYPPHDGEAVVDRIAGLIAKARQAKAPVFLCSIMAGAIIRFSPASPVIRFMTSWHPSPAMM